MKKNMKLNTIIMTLAAALLGAGALVSCQQEKVLPEPDALFRPIPNNPEYGGDWIEVSWDKYEGADYFELQIVGKDGLNETVQTDTTFYRFEGLNYDTSYDIMLRSLSRSTGLTSRFYQLATVTTNDFPTRLNPVTAIDNTARVSWTDETITRLVFFSYELDEDGERIETEYSEFAVPAGTDLAEVTDLLPGTSYVVYAYDGETYKGKKLFKTAAAEEYSGVVVDLRKVSGDEAYGIFTQDYVNGFIDANPDQDITFVLAGGTHYELATVNINATAGTVSIVTGLSFEGKATFEVSGNFAVNEGCAVNRILIKDVLFTEHPNKTKESSNFGGCYLFNFNKANASLQTLELVNCDIRYKRGVCRSQTTATIENYIIDGCTFDYIGGYGISNADNAAAYIRNIDVKNSTFGHCEKLFVSSKPTEKEVNINVENCTFIWMLGTSTLILDMNTMNLNASFKNCIFGPGGNKSVVSTINTYRAADGSSVSTDGCYGTTDLAWTMNAEGTAPNCPAFDLKSTGADAAGTFSKAVIDYAAFEEMDLKVIAKDVKAGDPRWL